MKGIILRMGCLELHHLFFVNDSLFFLQGTVENASRLKEIIMIYCRVSGQRINESKSTLTFNRGVDLNRRRDVKKVLQISSTSESGKYLGLSTVWGRSKKEALGYLKARICDKISGWGLRHSTKWARKSSSNQRFRHML